ncbi:Elongator complex protein 4 [Flammula alnicola]|nr:Elongator complex protein 4 [Flammula alnicola]
MSSFKRKPKSTGEKPTSLPVYPGTRISPASNLSLITSTGVSSLDDILGGGLPLSCSLLFTAPDIHSSYGELVQKYFVAQGLTNGHRVCIVGQDPEVWVKDVMWFPKSQGVGVGVNEADSDEGEENAGKSQKVKIAWRYEKMKQFKTTVGNTSQDGESYCAPFELSSRVPEEVIAEALEGKRLHLVDVGFQSLSTVAVLGEISRQLTTDGSVPLRICIPALGSPVWGDLTPQGILYFLHALRALLRKHAHGCASISLPPQLSTEGWGGTGWIEKLGWATDGALTMSAFTANPALSSAFPGHHGLLQMHRLPSPHTQSPASDRFSTLRGLTSSGENNLAFKCTRKRLVIETLHLDVEGGTGERRTTAAPSAHVEEQGHVSGAKVGRLEVELEEENSIKIKKKRVGFQSDRPELYDF